MRLNVSLLAPSRALVKFSEWSEPTLTVFARSGATGTSTPTKFGRLRVKYMGKINNFFRFWVVTTKFKSASSRFQKSECGCWKMSETVFARDFLVTEKNQKILHLQIRKIIFLKMLQGLRNIRTWILEMFSTSSSIWK